MLRSSFQVFASEELSLSGRQHSFLDILIFNFSKPGHVPNYFWCRVGGLAITHWSYCKQNSLLLNLGWVLIDSVFSIIASVPGIAFYYQRFWALHSLDTIFSRLLCAIAELMWEHSLHYTICTSHLKDKGTYWNAGGNPFWIPNRQDSERSCRPQLKATKCDT